MVREFFGRLNERFIFFGGVGIAEREHWSSSWFRVIGIVVRLLYKLQFMALCAQERDFLTRLLRENIFWIKF